MYLFNNELKEFIRTIDERLEENQDVFFTNEGDIGHGLFAIDAWVQDKNGEEDDILVTSFSYKSHWEFEQDVIHLGTHYNYLVK